MSNKGPEPRKALGKGLSALLPGRSQPPKPATDPTAAPSITSAAAAVAIEPTPAPGATLRLPIDSIEPNPVQPRTVFQGDKLTELAQSIEANGIIQPLIVQRNGARYQLVAGERRWRAAKLAGLAEVPVVVQDVAPDRLLEIALIENIQREDLNPIEIAQAFEKLGRELHLSHEEIGRRTGKDRTTVTNLLRLLKLPHEIQVLLAEHRLSMGHARAILAMPTEAQQLEVARKVVADGMSVRQVERIVQGVTQNRAADPSAQSKRAAATEPASPDPNVAHATRELESALGTRVRIVPQSADRGRIEIEYFSWEELDRIYNQIVGEK